MYEGLTNYEKATSSVPGSLLSTVLILKAACSGNACYLDRLISQFMRVLQRLVREHLHFPGSMASVSANTGSQDSNASLISEMIVISLDLLKSRVPVLSPEIRTTFFATVLSNLIEKTKDSKVLRAVVRMAEDWVKGRLTSAGGEGLSPRETSLILSRLQTVLDARFFNDTELRAQFFELILFVYETDCFKNTELTSKLENCFLAGLKCSQPDLRRRFFAVFDASVKRNLTERLMYIITAQNWDGIGDYYWIKVCVDLVLTAAAQGYY